MQVMYLKILIFIKFFNIYFKLNPLCILILKSVFIKFYLIKLLNI